MKNQQFALASLSIIIFLTSSCLVSSATKNSCPPVSGLLSWSPNEFEGTWYLYGTTGAAASPCRHSKLTYNKNTNAYDVTEYHGPTTIKSVAKVIGMGEFVLEDGTILGTRFIDQKQFTVVHGCKNLGGSYEETEFIWTRAPQPDSSVISNIQEHTSVPLSQFKLTNQKNCK